MSKQVWVREAAQVLSTTDGGFGIYGGALATGAAEAAKVQFPCTGTIDKLTILLDVAVAASATKVFTLNINGSSTALTGTIVAGQSGVVCTGGPVSVTAGDLVYIAYTHTGTPGASAIVTVSYLFSGTTAGESAYTGANFALNTTTPRWFGVFSIGEGGSTTAATEATNIASCAGTITKMYAGIIAAAGTTGSYKFTIYKNGVAQDGTSGTPDTRLTITNVITRVSQSVSFTLTVAAGDLLYIQVDSISTPSTKTGNLAIVFQATNSGESQLCWACPSFPSANGGVNNFNGPHNSSSGAVGWNTEANRASTVADKFKLSNMYVWAAVAPGATKSRTFENRKGFGSGSMTLTLSGTSTTATDLVHSDNYAALDVICFYESATANTPTASTGAVGFTQFVAGGNPPGKGQQGNKKNGGGSVNTFTPGGTQMLFTNAGVSSDSN